MLCCCSLIVCDAGDARTAAAGGGALDHPQPAEPTLDGEEEEYTLAQQGVCVATLLRAADVQSTKNNTWALILKQNKN